VAGVGPKSALAALSAMSVQQLCQAIVEGDMDRISLTPGIGKKTAQRISLELKDKVKALTIEGGELIHLQDDYEEAALALTALGYNRLQAEKAVNRVMKEGGAEKIEDIIRKALGVIAGG
ncbi:Holliday junction branch migration protein RuvA, partial [bacterium]|nr:Holliday junction branch migration protein RuvA [bacterium]